MQVKSLRAPPLIAILCIFSESCSEKKIYLPVAAELLYSLDKKAININILHKYMQPSRN